MEQNQTYVQILRDSLANKKRILNELIELTKKQSDIVKGGNPDVSEFDEVIKTKGRQIDMLNMIDDGFQNVYENVRTEILARPEQYKELLHEIQILISEDVELGAKLEALELNNKSYIEAFIRKKKIEIKEYKNSKNTTANYNKNMANQHVSGKSYFIDKKN